MATPIWTAAGEEDFGDFDGFVLGDDLPPLPDDGRGWSLPEGRETETKNKVEEIQPRGGFGVPNKKQKHKHFRNGPSQGNKKTSKHTASHNSSRMVMPSADDLRVSAMKGNVDALMHCLDQGVSVDTVLKCGWTPLMYAASCAHPDIIRALINNGAKPDCHLEQFTALMAGCSSTKMDEDSVLRSVELLVQAGADVNAHDRYHMSPLIYAARSGHTSVVDYLGQKGAQLNKQDCRGWTALSWAVSKNMRPTVQKLIELKADPYVKQCDGQTAADLALSENFQHFLVMMNDPRARPEDKPAIPTGVVTDQAVQKRSYGLTTSYVKHGELEVFLGGLNLGSLVDLFEHHHIDFARLLCLTEADLEKIGVEQVGVRKKLLEGMHKVHKKDWEASSLPAMQSNKQISESLAIMSNISSHLLYISTSVKYIRQQLTARPDILDSQDGLGPKVLLQQSTDSLVNLQSVKKETDSLQTYLEKALKNGNFKPADLVKKPKVRHRRGKLWQRRLVTVGAIAVTFSAAFYWRETITQCVTDTVIKVKCLF